MARNGSHLGAAVAHRARKRGHSFESDIFLYNFGEPEINENKFIFFWAKQNVVGFDIEVYNFEGMECSQLHLQILDLILVDLRGATFEIHTL